MEVLFQKREPTRTGIAQAVEDDIRWRNEKSQLLHGGHVRNLTGGNHTEMVKLGQGHRLGSRREALRRRWTFVGARESEEAAVLLIIALCNIVAVALMLFQLEIFLSLAGL